ncbi:MAG: acetolactate synthase small subunit [Candidatus Omnitrophica bacterium]|nr:acetolactate synthase small subunit [Candidatus Omnitrophota bacterium]MBU1047222.1 acetolactate synthase small subunit [Candidatus Omnitrophota bacterium]MBU1630746.1 acetolactate synthase small subunit [Candidatus Omnitrophota bacterium]MBU1767468.1 acetolactate synthase small subunit [Candidatus Omnitrophota bacterium]MBU1889192.1 acetolactate synthase small subunit [Candidatus Omnitrophota bacterium]
MKKHIISVLVENKSGVLSRIAALFAARGFNIDSLAVGETENPKVSRMTIVSEGEENVLEQVVKQLRRLIDVISVSDYTKKGLDYVGRELVLVKVDAPASKRSEIIEIVDIFRAKTVDVSLNALSIEITGTEEKIQAFLSLMHDFKIKEIVRTGKIAIVRENQSNNNQ